MNKDHVFKFFFKHKCKIIGALIGLIISTMVIFLGFVKTVFIIIIVGIGFFIGNKLDNNENVLENLKEILDRILPTDFR